MYYQRAELPRDNTACRDMPLCITQQVQTGGKCIQKRGIKSASVRVTPLTQLYLMLRDKLWAADWILGLWILNQIMTLIYQWEKLAQKQWQILQSLPTLVSLCFNMTILWSYPKPVSLLTFVINAEGSRLRSSQQSAALWRFRADIL